MTRPLCRHASAILPGQPPTGRLRACALGLYPTVTRLGACATCDLHSALGDPEVVPPPIAAGPPAKPCGGCKDKAAKPCAGCKEKAARLADSPRTWPGG